jgi:twinkle protein
MPLSDQPVRHTPVLRVVPKPMPPISTPSEDEQEAAYRWLASRGITRQTAVKAGVVGGVKFMDGENRPAVGFAYKQGSETYAVKWRSLLGKAFTQSGAANTLYLSEDAKQGGPIAITEGEMDCLSLRQVGVNAVSVPNGAVPPLAPGGLVKSPSRYDLKLSAVGNAKELIEAASKVIIAVDADDPGTALGEELARRIGRARCWRALWPDGCKDANDVLRLHGPDVLRECIDNAQPWPVKGLYDAGHFFDKVNALYDKGLPRGEKTGFQTVDELYTIVPGQLSIVTGAPGSGKSSFIDNVLVNLAKGKNWRIAVCSFENPPEVHVAKLAAIVGRQPFFSGPTPRMAPEKVTKVLSWVRTHFSFLHQSDGTLSSLDEILDLAKAAVMRYGIRGLVIDPYNFLDRGQANETDWVSDALTKLKVFAMAHDVHVWLCAHPTKLRRKEDGTFPVPTGYDIAGSAHFFNKADMGITIHRPDLLENKTEFHSWKVRFSFTGKVGKCDLSYDVATGLYWEKVTGQEDDC